MSLLTLVQEAAGSLNQPVPTVVFGSTIGDAVLWRNIALQEGRDLSRRHDWQILLTENTWTTTATEAQASGLPSDYEHLPPDPEVWDRTGGLRLTGPTSSREWQILKSRGITGGVGFWRIIGGVLNVYPAPSAGQTYALEYVSNAWVVASDGVTYKAAWTADDDGPRIPSRLLVYGIIWRWLRAKGMDYAEEMATYEREVERAAARDRAMDIMVVGGPLDDDPVTSQTWNGTIV